MKNKTMILGLTGGIASGKSTVAALLAANGIPVLCADEQAKEAVWPGSPAHKRIVEHFGQSILQKDGSLDRQKLAALVFKNESERKVLNGIVHPFVVEVFRQKIAEHRQKRVPMIVLDIPLLYEEGLEVLCDKVAVVYAAEPLMSVRLKARSGFSDEEVRARIASQMPIEEKKRRGDYVIDNSGSMEETKKQVEDLISRLSPPSLEGRG